MASARLARLSMAAAAPPLRECPEALPRASTAEKDPMMDEPQTWYCDEYDCEFCSGAFTD